jgi:hypothetical protein
VLSEVRRILNIVELDFHSLMYGISVYSSRLI